MRPLISVLILSLAPLSLIGQSLPNLTQPPAMGPLALNQSWDDIREILQQHQLPASTIQRRTALEPVLWLEDRQAFSGLPAEYIAQRIPPVAAQVDPLAQLYVQHYEGEPSTRGVVLRRGDQRLTVSLATERFDHPEFRVLPIGGQPQVQVPVLSTLILEDPLDLNQLGLGASLARQHDAWGDPVSTRQSPVLDRLSLRFYGSTLAEWTATGQMQVDQLREWVLTQNAQLGFYQNTIEVESLDGRTDTLVQWRRSGFTVWLVVPAANWAQLGNPDRYLGTAAATVPIWIQAETDRLAERREQMRQSIRDDLLILLHDHVVDAVGGFSR